MIDRSQVRPPVQARLAQVQGSVSRAAAELAEQHPHHGLRGALDDLRGRLAQVHDRCHRVEDEVWTAYTARLDRGLDELQVELARVVENPDAGKSVDEVLFTQTTRLELDGWLVRLDVPGAAADPARARAIASVASRELADYGANSGRESGASRTGVEQAMAELRRTAR